MLIESNMLLKGNYYLTQIMEKLSKVFTDVETEYILICMLVNKNAVSIQSHLWILLVYSRDTEYMKKS